jgi:hypothetical protein
MPRHGVRLFVLFLLSARAAGAGTAAARTATAVAAAGASRSASRVSVEDLLGLNGFFSLCQSFLSGGGFEDASLSGLGRDEPGDMPTIKMVRRCIAVYLRLCSVPTLRVHLCTGQVSPPRMLLPDGSAASDGAHATGQRDATSDTDAAAALDEENELFSDQRPLLGCDVGLLGGFPPTSASASPWDSIAGGGSGGGTASSAGTVTGAGIEYHGGAVMGVNATGTRVHLIWYGNWTGNSALTLLPHVVTYASGAIDAGPRLSVVLSLACCPSGWGCRRTRTALTC